MLACCSGVHVSISRGFAFPSSHLATRFLTSLSALSLSCLHRYPHPSCPYLECLRCPCGLKPGSLLQPEEIMCDVIHSLLKRDMFLPTSHCRRNTMDIPAHASGKEQKGPCEPNLSSSLPRRENCTRIRKARADSPLHPILPGKAPSPLFCGGKNNFKSEFS